MNNRINYVGHRQGWGETLPFGLSSTDQRFHLYIIAKTGSGKTTLLRNLIIQHIAAGHGVGLIDPHGELAEELHDHIPPSRADDLVYFDPGDPEFPIALNLLSGVSPDERHLVSGVVGAFKSIWHESWGPRLEYILSHAIAALLECENTSLLGINRMLVDADYRRWVVRQVSDPFVKASPPMTAGCSSVSCVEMRILRMIVSSFILESWRRLQAGAVTNSTSLGSVFGNNDRGGT